MAARLADTPIGQVPAKQTRAGQNGRTRFEWLAKNVGPWRGEPSAEPVSVSGPALFLTTLAGWDQLADWYRGLLQGREALTPELRQVAEEWTAGAAGPEEIVRILNRHVADDIRYTGLEFDIAGFQPKTPAEVWHSGYGDCKDKANLLRALLADQGIPSSLALINTHHAGAIETRSPDFRQFNHAILAIKTRHDGSYLWADPTIPFLDPGQLGPGDGERQAFLIPAEGWRFATTPAAGPARLEATAELTLEAGNELEGSLVIEADQFYASSNRDAFLGNEDERLRVATNVVGAFFEKAEVLDVALDDMPRGQFRAKIFFTTEKDALAVDGGPSLLAEDGGWLENRLEQRGTRRGSYHQVREQITIRLRWRLPAGFAPRELPGPFAVDLPALRSRGTWTCDPESCQVELVQENRRSLVPAGDFAALLQAKKAFDAWLRKPVQLAHGAETLVAAPVQPNLLDEFRLMPTGAGQLRLLEHKYPSELGEERRRAALNQILQWFPGDKTTLFQTQMLLGNLDCESPSPSAATDGAQRLRGELARFEGAVPTALMAWGRYLLAICPSVEETEATELLRRNADDPTVGAERRAWSLLQWAKIVGERSPAEALPLTERAIALTEALAADAADLASFAWPTRFRYLLRAEHDVALEPLLEEALVGEHRTEIAGAITDLAARLASGGEEEAADRLYRAFLKVAARQEGLASEVAELRRAFAAREAAGLQAELAQDLAKLFATEAPVWWSSQEIDASSDRKVIAQKVQELDKARKIAPFVRQAVDYLTRFPPATDFSERLHQVAWCFDKYFSDTPQVDRLIALLTRLPKSDDYHWEGEVIAGSRLARQGKTDEDTRFYEGLLADRELTPGYLSVFTTLLAGTQLDAGNLAEASRRYTELEAKADLSVPLTVDGLLRATLFELESGRTDEALRYLRKLRQIGAETIAASSSPEQASDLLALAADEAAARKAWAGAANWWPLWLEIEAKAELPRPGPVAPLIGDLATLGRLIGDALRANDSRAALEAMRDLAHAARWQPSLVHELSALTNTLSSAKPELEASFHAMAIAAHRSVPPFADADLAGKNYLLLASHLIATNQAAEALAPLDAMSQLSLGGDLNQRAKILLAFVAAGTGQERERAALELSRALDDSFPTGLRGTAVSSLASLYKLLGRRDEERSLLEREIHHPAIEGTPLVRDLESRLEANRRGGGADEFAQAFGEWQARFPLPVLTYAEPTNLDDPRLQGKKTEALTDDADWLAAEKVKIAFLAALDPQRPVAARSTLLASVILTLEGLVPRQGKYQQMLSAMLDEPRFPPFLRANAALILGAKLVSIYDFAGFDTLLEKEGGLLRPIQRELLLSWREMVEIDQRGPAAIEEHLAALLSQKLSKVQAQQFEQLWPKLILRGEDGVAERFEKRLDGLSLAEGNRDEEDELRFASRRALVELAEVRRSLEALRGLLLTDKKTPSRPAAFADMVGAKGFESLPASTCRELLLYDLATLELGVAETLKWPREMLTCLAGAKAPGSEIRDLLFTALDALSRDEDRANLLLSAAAIGEDDPVWPSLIQGAKKRIHSEKEKKSWQTLHLLELQGKLRSGEKVDWDSEAGALSGLALSLLKHRQTTSLLRDRDLAPARAFPAGLSASELKSELGMFRRVQLVQLISQGAAKKSAESQLVESSARRQLYEAQISALSYASFREGITAIRLAHALDGKASYPAAWLEALLADIENELGRTGLLLFDAEARQDWAALYQHAKTLITLEHPDHDDQWYLGRAAFELGKKEEAKAALELFLEVAKDSPHQKEARELLARLEGRKSSPVAQ